MELKVGVKVWVERDEKRWPSKGTWPQYRGRVGTIASINVDADHPHLTEYGVGFGVTGRRTEVWFKAYELRRTRGRTVRE